MGCLYAVQNDFENAYECFKILKYKKKEYFKEVPNDPELKEFIKSDYYLSLLNEK